MNTTIQSLQLRLQKIEEAKQYAPKVKQRIEENKVILKEAKEKLAAENEDVEELHRLSISYLYAILRNTKEERIKKEKLEALLAQHNVDQCTAKDCSLRSQYRKLCVLLDEEDVLKRKL